MIFDGRLSSSDGQYNQATILNNQIPSLCSDRPKVAEESLKAKSKDMFMLPGVSPALLSGGRYRGFVPPAKYSAFKSAFKQQETSSDELDLACAKKMKFRTEQTAFEPLLIFGANCSERISPAEQLEEVVSQEEGEKLSNAMPQYYSSPVSIERLEGGKQGRQGRKSAFRITDF